MTTPQQPEVWLRGPIAEIPALLQPVAHALLQAREEVETLLIGFPEACLWEKPTGMASPGFHLQHLAGVIDRLFTYGRANPCLTNSFMHLPWKNRLCSLIRAARNWLRDFTCRLTSP